MLNVNLTVIQFFAIGLLITSVAQAQRSTSSKRKCVQQNAVERYNQDLVGPANRLNEALSNETGVVSADVKVSPEQLASTASVFGPFTTTLRERESAEICVDYVVDESSSSRNEVKVIASERKSERRRPVIGTLDTGSTYEQARFQNLNDAGVNEALRGTQGVVDVGGAAVLENNNESRTTFVPVITSQNTESEVTASVSCLEASSAVDRLSAGSRETVGSFHRSSTEMVLEFASQLPGGANSSVRSNENSMDSFSMSTCNTYVSRVERRDSTRNRRQYTERARGARTERTSYRNGTRR